MTDSLQELKRRLAEAADCGLHRFDPVQFRYIEALARRSAGLRVDLGRRLADKALQAIEVLADRHARERADVSVLVDHVVRTCPSAAERAKDLFACSDYKGVRRLRKKLDQPGASRSALAPILERFAQEQEGDDSQRGGALMDEALFYQEEQILRSAEAVKGPAIGARRKMLRSFHLFRQSWMKQHADELVSLAITQSPENPGPLNGQMLATRSLSSMRTLSSCYLGRFVAYVDTLLWLQQAHKDMASHPKTRS